MVAPSTLRRIMPFYEYACENEHVNLLRRGYDDEAINCPDCGLPAVRLSVYHDQYIFGETCAKNQRRAEVPRDEKRVDLSLFQEAGAELEYEHKKMESIAGRPLASKSLWSEAKKRAAAIRAGKAPPVQAQTRFKHRSN